jgi:hypothetical protein
VLTLECDPRDTKNAFMRIEYNPALISYTHIATCLNDIMPDGIECFFEGGSVSRFDVALDVRDVRLVQIILDYANFIYRRPTIVSGRLETLYIGKDTGCNQIYMYNKGKELKKHKIKPLSDYQHPQYDLTRIELRHRPDPSPKFKELYGLKNLFEGMIIAGTPLLVKEDDYFNVLRDVCVLKGMRHAIKQFSMLQRKYFAERIGKYVFPNFLNLEKLWATLPGVLDQIYPAPALK